MNAFNKSSNETINRQPSLTSQTTTCILLPATGTLPKAFYNYLKITTSDDVLTICKPLTKLHIKYFLYVKKLPDGSYIHLTNNADWQTFFYENHHYLKSDFEDPKQSYPTGHFLWSALSYQELYQIMRNSFNIDHGITLVKEFDNCQEFYHFGSTSDLPSITNFYLNNIDLLHKFVLYFKDKALPLITAIINSRILLPLRADRSLTILEDNNLKKEFLNEIKTHKYYLSGKNSDIYLTQREVECLKWYVAGKTAGEIAIILNISKRTVESHIEHIKTKTNCYNKSSLNRYFGSLKLEIENK